MTIFADILHGINHSAVNQRIVQCIAAFNEQDLIEYTLKSIYDEVDSIIVVQGAVGIRSDATEDGHSKDATVELIEAFPDPQNKIKLVQNNRPWESLEEQKSVFLEMASEGDVLLINDADEFYEPEDIRALRKILKDYPDASQFVPSFIHLWRDFEHCAKPSSGWQVQHQRIIRYQNGMRYEAHPVATDKYGRSTYFDAAYSPRRYVIPNMYIWHYGFVRSRTYHAHKINFYNSELKKWGFQNGHNKKHYDFIKDTEDLSDVLKVDVEEHPLIMQQHQWASRKDKRFDGSKFEYWRFDPFYSLQMKTPLCWSEANSIPWMARVNTINILDYTDDVP